MTFQEYHLETRRTLPHLDKVYLFEAESPKEVHIQEKIDFVMNKINWKRVSSLPDDLLETTHMVLGMISEVDELSNAQDKADLVNIREELIDICWYASNYAFLRKIDISGYQFPRTGVSSLEDIALSISRLSDYTKKFLSYKRVPNRDNEVRDYFNLLDTIGEFANMYKIDLYVGFKANIDKLRVRFPDKFDFTRAQEENRDLAKERKTLEQ